MSNLLLDDKPLIVLPSLATHVGLNEAIVLQQLHYWLKESTNVKEGFKWVYNTYEDWQKQFPFWSISTIRRIITKLENQRYIIASNFNSSKIDKTKWYRIDYEKLKGMNSPSVQNEQSNSQGEQSSCSKRIDEALNVNRPIPENTTEITYREIDDEERAHTKMAESDGAPNTDRNGDDLLTESKAEISQTADYALTLEQLFIQRRGRGLYPSAKDLQSIQEVVQSGIALEDAVRWLHEAFDSYQPKYPGDTINAFAFVKRHIFHQAYLQKERELAVKQAKENPTNFGSYQPKPAKRYYGRSGRKEMVPDWLENQKHEQEIESVNNQMDFEAEKAMLEAELAQYRKGTEE